jgi:hypothetical protein
MPAGSIGSCSKQPFAETKRFSEPIDQMQIFQGTESHFQQCYLNILQYQTRLTFETGESIKIGQRAVL